LAWQEEGPGGTDVIRSNSSVTSTSSSNDDAIAEMTTKGEMQEMQK
jgi:hypothetical protein